MAVSNKSFVYKIYNETKATLLKTYSSSVVTNLPSFSSQINGGFSACSLMLDLPFDDYGEGTIIDYGHIVEIYEVDSNNPNGRIVYTGYISRYSPFLKGENQGVKIDLLGLVSLLVRDYYKDGASFTKVHSTIDPADIIRAIINQANTVLPASLLSHTASTIDDLGSNVSYTFTAKKWIQAIDEAFALFGGGWYWTVDKVGAVYVKQKPSTATHTFTIGKDVEAIDVVKSGETLVNDVTYDYDGGTATDSDTPSQTSFGKHALYINDTGTSDATTANNKAQDQVDNNKELKISAKIKINTEYDIESVKVGDTCKVRNFKSTNTTFTDNMQIVHISYNPNFLDIQLEEVVTFGTELLKATS